MPRKERLVKEAAFAMKQELDSEMSEEQRQRMLKSGMGISGGGLDKGEAEVFAKKLTKEEKKAQTEAKRAALAEKKAAEKAMKDQIARARGEVVDGDDDGAEGGEGGGEEGYEKNYDEGSSSKADAKADKKGAKAKVSAIGPRWWLRCAASVEAASVEVSVEAAAAIGLSLLPSLLSAVAAVAAGAALARAFAAEVALQLASSRPTLLHASALPPCHAATPRSALSKQMSVRCGPSHRCCCRCLG
jgi:hypothetical protein